MHTITWKPIKYCILDEELSIYKGLATCIARYVCIVDSEDSYVARGLKFNGPPGPLFLPPMM